jgi:hypothetical protein
MVYFKEVLRRTICPVTAGDGGGNIALEMAFLRLDPEKGLIRFPIPTERQLSSVFGFLGSILPHFLCHSSTPQP